MEQSAIGLFVGSFVGLLPVEVGALVGLWVLVFGVVMGSRVVGALVGLVVLGFGEVGRAVALAAEAARSPEEQTDAMMTKTMDPLAKFIEYFMEKGGGDKFLSIILSHYCTLFNH